MDPLGRPPNDEILNKKLNETKSRNIYYNSKQIQSFQSNYCGMYCMLFILANAGARKNAIKSVYFSTADRDEKNENRCISYLSRYFDINI